MKLLLFMIFSLTLVQGFYKANDHCFEFKEGDVVFQISKSPQSKAIQIATNSKYSHVGIVFRNKNKFHVLEAVQPVKYTELQNWIKKGQDDSIIVKRLIKYERILTPSAIQMMKKVGDRFLGSTYDKYFEWSDNRIYCSELVWKIFKRALDIELGKLRRLKEFNLSHPIVREKLKERYGDNIPYQEFVISPDDIFNSNLLSTVYTVSAE